MKDLISYVMFKVVNTVPEGCNFGEQVIVKRC
jgi:hypothetical protein